MADVIEEKKKVGRKLGTTNGGTGYKKARIVATCTEEEFEKAKQLAQKNHMTLTAFVLYKLFKGEE